MTGAATDARARRTWIALLITALVLDAIYLFVISTGHLTHWPFYVAYLNDQAEGFRQGHLHLAVEPAHALAVAANPLSGENASMWYWDVSLYHGHYYLYWGPVPALLLAAGKILFRVHERLSDSTMVFSLSSLQLAAVTWTVGRAARSLFDDPPLGLQVLALAVIGLGNPVIYNLARPAVYEAAIIGAHAFLMLGMALSVEALSRPDRPNRWLALAGTAWAFALGCRISVAPAVALLALLVAARWAAGGGRAGLRRGAAALASVGAPLAAGLGLLLLYNRLRFDDWLEFGRRFQLTWIAAPTAARFVVPNAYSYLLRTPLLSCRFPYVSAPADMGAAAFPAGTKLPEGYFVYEQVAGILPAFPWSWAIPAAWIAAARAWWRRAGDGRHWAILLASVAGIVPLLPALTLASSTNRYLGDVVGGLGLTAAFGVWSAHRAALQRDRAAARAVTAAAVTLGLMSMATGLLLGFMGQYNHFPSNNPALTEKLVHDLSFCGPTPPAPAK
jgi:hypothetical protein